MAKPGKTNKLRGLSTSKINIWTMVNNVLLASLAKGQFLTTLAFITFIAIILKMPQADVARLAFAILADLEKGSLLGYVLTPVVTVGWFLHAKRQRQRFAEELRRMAQRRDELQERVLPAGLLES